MYNRAKLDRDDPKRTGQLRSFLYMPAKPRTNRKKQGQGQLAMNLGDDSNDTLDDELSDHSGGDPKPKKARSNLNDVLGHLVEDSHGDGPIRSDTEMVLSSANPL